MKLFVLSCGIALSATAMAVAEPADGTDPSLFAGTFAQSVAAIIVFLILLAVLSKFAWGPILKGLQEREVKIKGDLDRAETAAKEATATLEAYEAKLAEARTEAGQVIEQAKTEAQRVADQIKRQAETEIDQLRRRAESDIAAAKQQALGEIYTQAADLSTAVAGQILKRQIAPEDHQQLIEESLKALSSDRS